MKITKTQLQQIIKEELDASLQEGLFDDVLQRGQDALMGPVKEILKEKVNEYICTTLAEEIPRIVDLSHFVPDMFVDMIPDGAEAIFDHVVSQAVCKYGTEIADYIIETGVANAPELLDLFGKIGSLFESIEREKK